ncbi:MAG: RNA polymerase sigma factor [Clostridia bacterium]|nr:RNA polymerase sigma factor [Clostridia bacterium]
MTNEAFAERIIAMQPTLYRVSCSLLRQACDREDAVQSCIMHAWQKRHLLRDESKLQAWVTRILINESYAILRRSRRETPIESIPDTPAPPSADPDLYRFFTGLTEKLRLPMVLHYVEGYDVREIAAILRIPQGTVKTRLMRGREKMKQAEYFQEVQDL